MQNGSLSVRRATTGDAAACVAIYRPYVEQTAVSWETVVPTVTDMGARITTLRASHEWLVVERDNRVVGFAYGQSLKRLLPAMVWTAETGIYIDSAHHSAKFGTALYAELLRRLAERGYRRAIAGITMPNERSTAFHRSLGFHDAGRFHRVLWKLGAWHDVAWMQCDLLDDADRPAAPRPIT